MSFFKYFTVEYRHSKCKQFFTSKKTVEDSNYFKDTSRPVDQSPTLKTCRNCMRPLI